MNTAVMKGAVRAGLVAGIAVWFLALVGIIERLADLSIIGGSLTMDQILIFLPAALAGWVAVRPRVISGALQTPRARSAIGYGLAAGLAAGLLVAAGLLLVNMIGLESVRTVFVALSPTLMDQLYLGLEPVVGTVVLVAGMVVIGSSAGGVRSLPAEIHRPIVAGLAGVIAVALLERVVAPAFDQMGIEKDWLYSKKLGGLELDRGDRRVHHRGPRRTPARGAAVARHPAARSPVGADHGDHGAAHRTAGRDAGGARAFGGRRGVPSARPASERPVDPDRRVAHHRRAARGPALPRGSGGVRGSSGRSASSCCSDSD